MPDVTGLELTFTAPEPNALGFVEPRVRASVSFHVEFSVEESQRAERFSVRTTLVGSDPAGEAQDPDDLQRFWPLDDSAVRERYVFQHIAVGHLGFHRFEFPVDELEVDASDGNRRVRVSAWISTEPGGPLDEDAPRIVLSKNQFGAEVQTEVPVRDEIAPRVIVRPLTATVRTGRSVPVPGSGEQ